MMDSPSGSASPIFTDAQNQPLQIFVEASNIKDRPKLIRSLRVGLSLKSPCGMYSPRAQRYGAKIEHRPADAHIILVDETAPDSVIFAAEWPHKLVLDFRWVHKAIREGRYCGPSEQWGGCCVRVHTPDSPRDTQAGTKTK